MSLLLGKRLLLLCSVTRSLFCFKKLDNLIILNQSLFLYSVDLIIACSLPLQEEFFHVCQSVLYGFTFTRLSHQITEIIYVSSSFSQYIPFLLVYQDCPQSRNNPNGIRWKKNGLFPLHLAFTTNSILSFDTFLNAFHMNTYRWRLSFFVYITYSSFPVSLAITFRTVKKRFNKNYFWSFYL